MRQLLQYDHRETHTDLREGRSEALPHSDSEDALIRGDVFGRFACSRATYCT